MPSTTRILLTKPTHDCHDRGVRYLMRMMRDAGFEVIFTNFLLADEIVATALQEDVAAIGISSSSGGHMPVFEDLMRMLGEQDATDILVIGGGIIPDDDAATLRTWGVHGVFGPGSAAEDIIAFVREQLAARAKA